MRVASAAGPDVGDRCCRYLADSHYENFLVTSLLVPPRLRSHLRRLYAFCRVTDDLGDESGAVASIRLERWRDDLARCFGDSAGPLHPVLVALAGTIAEHHLPREPFFDLVEANLQDQRVTWYESWPQLRAYCQLSAAPVGQLVLRLFGHSSPALDRLSDDVCVGLQLANFAQDVSVDRAKGRSYLPQTDLRALGVAGAVRATCQRAHELLESGRLLEALVGGRLGLQLSLYRLGGEAILRAIAAIDYQTAERRPRVSAAAKLALLARAGAHVLRRSSDVGARQTA
jgi:squalene synthase HpnC